MVTGFVSCAAYGLLRAASSAVADMARKPTDRPPRLAYHRLFLAIGQLTNNPTLKVSPSLLMPSWQMVATPAPSLCRQSRR